MPIPTGKFRGGYSVPRQLSLYKENGIYKLRQKPINLKGIEQKMILVNAPKTLKFNSNSYILNLNIELKNQQQFELNLLESGDEKVVINYDKATETLSFDRRKSGNTSFHEAFASIETMQVFPENGFINLKILVDNSIVEIFGNDGKAVLTDLVFPRKGNSKVSFSYK